MLALVPLLISCKGAQAPEKAPEEVVREKAAARWEAVLGKDYDAAYSFLSPGFRSRETAEKYRGRFVEGKAEWKQAEVVGVTCEEESCVVMVDAKYLFAGVPPFPPMEVETQEEEQWVFTQGEWWHVPRR
jgi:hypothetical protein